MVQAVKYKIDKSPLNEKYEAVETETVTWQTSTTSSAMAMTP
jgi:hypothetical protein